MGTRQQERREIIDRLCSDLEEIQAERIPFAGDRRRKTAAEFALCRSFIRQGAVPYEFLLRIANKLVVEPEETAKFIEDVASVCHITGPDLIVQPTKMSELVR